MNKPTDKHVTIPKYSANHPDMQKPAAQAPTTVKVEKAPVMPKQN